MLIIHRYLLRQFLQVFIICFCSLMGLYVVIDAFQNLEEFVHYGDRHGGVLAVVVKYYGYRSFSFFDATSGIVALIAAMFTLASFQRFNELTALLAAGIPKWRVIKPIVGAAVAIAGLGVLNRELIIPAIRDNLSHDVHDLTGDRAKDLAPKQDSRTGVLLTGRQTIAKSEQIVDPSFLLPANWDAPFKRLQAANAFYHAAEGDRPAGYLLKGMSLPRDIDKHASLPRQGAPVVLSPHDYKWLAPDECFVASDITFEQLEGNDAWQRLASTIDMISAWHNPSLALGADVAVLIHGRFVQPLLDVTLLFLGLPLIMRGGNRNVFVAIGLCLVVVVGFLLIVTGSQQLGSGYLLPPDIAVWIPLLIFVPIAMATSQPLRE